MKLGIFGGSFNPVHLGHLHLADAAFSMLKLDRIVFVPAFHSPFKPDADVHDNVNDRVDMLAAAIAGDSRFTIDLCEIRRQGVSYTIDTLEDIIIRYQPHGKPDLIIGDDLAEDFPKWHDSKRILQLAHIVVARRNNSAPVKYSFHHTAIENEAVNISSQEIRQKIEKEYGAAAGSAEQGFAWRSLVPSGARAIIEDRRLYGCQANEAGRDCTQAVIQKVEASARETLSMERFLHSRNTAVHALDLCRRFGLDEAAGYLAGISHDLAKQMDNKHLLKIVKESDYQISSLEKKRPNLLHGKAAAILLRERFCIHNKEVLEAVAFHTSGNEHMGPLAKIIYIADKTESSRNIDSALRRMCSGDLSLGSSDTDLDRILSAVVEKMIHKLKVKEMDLSRDTLMLLESIKGREN